MPSHDPDDRQYIAAAIAGGAATIVTWNRIDFPPEPLGELGLRVVDPGGYLQEGLRAGRGPLPQSSASPT